MISRNICILTQPLTNGYGGLLQAYALQTVLRRLGHKVMTENRKHNATIVERVLDNIKLFLAPIVGPFMTLFTQVYYSSKMTERIINKAPDYFKSKYLATTAAVYSNTKETLKRYHFDTYIVGSDQVWRPKYSFGEGSILNYFLDFTEGQEVKRISYAASFGVPYCEFTSAQKEKCGALLRRFDAVGVREEKGVEQCQEYFGVDAQLVLDPTILLDKRDYENLVYAENEPKFDKSLFCYFLDPSKEKEEMVEKVAKRKSLVPFSIMPTEHYYNVGKKYIDKCKYRSVTSWLRAFMDAEFVITDSFHGTVFSIIFNKPFITIANRDRGVSRFESLLNLFGLENRMVHSKEDIEGTLACSSIDFCKVNEIRNKERLKSIKFLSEALK